MLLFYTNDIKDDWATLSEEETQHLNKVLRKRLGDQINFVDGKGGWYTGIIFELSKKSALIQIQEKRQKQELPYQFHLAIAPTKNINRIEWLLEKATEIGIHTIYPITSFHSERKIIKPVRLEKILQSAMKQSLNAFLPQLRPLQSFSDFLKTFEQNQEGPFEKYIAYIHPEIKLHLQDNYSPGQNVVILIGPEGGFSPQEADLAIEHGFQPVSLGESRLRTETAGLLATAIIQLKNL
ncbi:MAG: RsmE family RNA methyltransferase [Bacteroidota bacterium]